MPEPLPSLTMKLASALASLANKIVCSDLPKFRKKDSIGILFDASGFNRAQWSAIFEQFGDCEPNDYKNLLVPKDDDEGGWTFRDDALPFMLWSPDELFDDRTVLKKKLAKNPTAKTVAFARGFGESPQYQTMWFLHADGSVTYADIDGTFSPQKKSKLLVDDFKKLKLRLATPDDVTEE